MSAQNMTLALITAAMVIAGMEGLADSSEPIQVDSDVRSAHWTTVFTNAVPLNWSWPTGATHAKLDIVGMNSTFTTNFATVVSNCVWHAFETDSPSAEDAYDLNLTFYTGSEAVVETLTACLTVVKGAFGESAVNAVAASTAWSKLRDNVVIPYDTSFSVAATNAAVAQLVIAKVGGAVQTNSFADVAGYFGWKIRNSGWGYGVFDLSLTFPGTAADARVAELTRPMDGTTLRVR